MGGVGDPRFEIACGPGGGSETVHDIEADGQAVFLREFPPVVVNGQGVRVPRCPANSDPGSGGRKGGQQDQFAQVLAADSANGSEKKRMGGCGVSPHAVPDASRFEAPITNA